MGEKSLKSYSSNLGSYMCVCVGGDATVHKDGHWDGVGKNSWDGEGQLIHAVRGRLKKNDGKREPWKRGDSKTRKKLRPI